MTNAILPRNLENIWNGATDAQKATAETEARILLENLVGYGKRQLLANDRVLAAATLLWFRKLVSDNLNDQSNIISEEQVAKLTRRVNSIAQQFNEGAVHDHEMLAAIIHELSEAGVRF